jgi:tetratricopeptide (TPR) repeat protein
LALEAIALLENSAVTDTEKRVLADAYRYHDIAASELEGDSGMIHLQHALELYNATSDEHSKAKVLNLLGIRAYYRGAWSMAATLYGQSGAAAAAAGNVVGAAIESANAAEILIDQGRLAEARPLIRSALHVFEASDNPYLVAFVTDFDGRARLRSGDPDAAAEAFRSAAEGFTALGEHDEAIDARVRLIEAELDAGRLDVARAVLADLPPDASGARLKRQQSRLAVTDGDAAAARTLVAMAVDHASTPFERALSLAHRFALDGSAADRAEAERIMTELGVVDIDAALDIRPLPSLVTEPE